MRAKQTIAMLDRETGKSVEHTLTHDDETVRAFYGAFARAGRRRNRSHGFDGLVRSVDGGAGHPAAAWAIRPRSARLRHVGRNTIGAMRSCYCGSWWRIASRRSGCPSRAPGFPGVAPPPPSMGAHADAGAGRTPRDRTGARRAPAGARLEHRGPSGARRHPARAARRRIGGMNSRRCISTWTRMSTAQARVQESTAAPALGRHVADDPSGCRAGHGVGDRRISGRPVTISGRESAGELRGADPERILQRGPAAPRSSEQTRESVPPFPVGRGGDARGAARCCAFRPIVNTHSGRT